jgi:uncharacterized protein (TIGR02594 family)
MLTGEHREGPAAALKVTALSLARRYLGVKEIDGPGSNPHILAWLSRVAPWANDDEIPWCSAFVFHLAWLLELERPQLRPAAARSWLMVGTPVQLADARPGFDVVVMTRGDGAPGPDVLEAPGHVGFYVESLGPTVAVLGGNQGDAVSVRDFQTSRILGIRRLPGVA